MKNFELQSKKIDGKEKWYFYYPNGNKTCMKTIPNCKTKEEAEKNFTRFQSRFNKENQYLIRNVANDMFLNESEHVLRLQNFGKNLSYETIHQKRKIIELIIKEFGDYKINELNISQIENYLLKDKSHSGSWKNTFLETFGSIYEETIWKCAVPVPKPQFQKFARNSKKPDIFTEEELNKIFNKELWSSYTEWLLFYVTAYCGLRLGEARALQVRQIKIKEGILVIDGFLKHNGFRTNYNKKGNANDRKIRCVPIPNKILEELIKYISYKKLDNSDYLFLDENNRTYTTCHLEHNFRKVLIASNIKLFDRKLVPHSLRFTYVTRMRMLVSVDEVRKIVGHTTNEMTEYYTRMMISDMCKSLQQTRGIVNQLL